MRPSARVWALAVLILASLTSTAANAQDTPPPSSTPTVATLRSEGDAAFDEGDTGAAERAYQAVLAIAPSDSRALFRLGQLRRRDDPAAAVRLFTEYVLVEPSDPWGYLALADAMARAGKPAEAVGAYEKAFARAPNDRDIALGRPRLLAQLVRTDAAISAYEEWVALHAEDAEAWRELGIERQRAGRSRGAIVAFERAQALMPGTSELARRIEALRTQRAPAVEFGGIGVLETGVSATGGSIGADLAAGDTGRVGFTVMQRRLSSFGDTVHTQRFVGRMRVRPQSGLDIAATAGAVSLPAAPGEPRLRSDLALRLRQRSGPRGPVIDIRAQHQPIEVTPQLARDPVMRSQASAAIDIPAGSLWRLRGQLRVARLARNAEENRRTGLGGGIAVVAAPEVRLTGQWQHTRHSNPKATGYFSPARADTADAGLEFEREYERVSVSLDVGGGLQRVQRDGQTSIRWRPAFRGWGVLAWSIGSGRQLLVEAETYDSQISNGLTIAERWRYASVTASVRLSLR